MPRKITALETDCNTSEEPLSRIDLLILSEAQERLLRERVSRGLDADQRSIQHLAAIRNRLQRIGGTLA